MKTDVHLEANDVRSLLHRAALNGNLNLCKMLIDKHEVNVNVADKRGWTAVHFAAQSGNCRLVAYFVEMGSDIHLKTNDGSNCLHIAALEGHLNLCKILIHKHKVDLHMSDNYGWTGIHFSAHSGNCELFVYFTEMGIDIRLKTNDGRNCLHFAAAGGHLNLCKMLIDNYKLDFHMTDNDGWTVLHYSAYSGKCELVAYFAEMGTDICPKTNGGRNCLHFAAFEGHLNICKMLIYKHKVHLHMTDNDGWTALHCSARSGNCELVAYFAEMGTDIHLKTNDGRNCLHIAALDEHLNLCKMLIDKHKVDVNVADKRGWTAVHFSAQSGNCQLVAYFAEMGTDVHLKTNDGSNCLNIAAYQGHLNLCKMLIDKHKVDVNVADKRGWTAVHFSAQSGNCQLVAYFAEMGTDIHLKANDGNNCHNIAAFQGHLSLCKMLMDKHKIDLHMSNNDGWTALHYSAQRGNSEVVAYFAEMGTDICLKTNDGTNCLQIAALQGHFNLCKMLIDKHLVDLHMTDNYGWTELHCSAQSGNCELVAYFAEMGTDIHLKTNDGRNCLHIAALDEHLNLCKMLIDKHKVDVNVADKRGWTAVHFSAQSGNCELVAYFAEIGTDINMKTNDGRNCLHIAGLEGHLNLCKML